MARKISVSFKETTRDIKLYDLIMEQEDKSYFIKEILRSVLIKEKEEEAKVIKKVKTECDLLDF